MIEYDDLDNGKYKNPITNRERKNTRCESLQNIINKKFIKYFYQLKYEYQDGLLVNNCKNLIHVVFNHSNEEKHGNVYATISKTLGKDKFPYIHHMVKPFPGIVDNLRKQYNVPDNALVFGRYGGYDRFNIFWVHEVIKKIVNKKKNIDELKLL